jgi:hypothetical protein
MPHPILDLYNINALPRRSSTRPEYLPEMSFCKSVTGAGFLAAALA